MYSLTDVYYGFAIAFSTFQNTEVDSYTPFTPSFLAITAISLSMLAMAYLTPTHKTRTTQAATHVIDSTRSVRISLFEWRLVVMHRSTITPW